MKKYAFGMPESQYHQLKRSAEEQSRSMASICREALDNYFGSWGEQIQIELDFDWGTPTNHEFVYEHNKAQAEELRAEAKRLGMTLQDYCRQILSDHIADAKAKERSYEDDLFALAHSLPPTTEPSPVICEWSCDSAYRFIGQSKPPGFERSKSTEDNWKSFIAGVHRRQRTPRQGSRSAASSQDEIDRQLNEMWA